MGTGTLKSGLSTGVECAEQSPIHISETGNNIQLQSLRGIAACVVMVHHSLRIIGHDGWAWFVGTYLLNGPGAVVLFFVLSGFVLAKSLMRRGLGLQTTITFYFRRAFRIYPALWFAMVLGALYMLAIQPLNGAGLAQWVVPKFNKANFGVIEFLRDTIGLGAFLVPVAWSISVELLASLFLPIIVTTIIWRRWVIIAMLPILIAISFLSGAFLFQLPRYLYVFVIGALLACLPVLQKWRPRGWITALSIMLLIGFRSVLPSDGYEPLVIFVECISSAIIIAAVNGRSIEWMRHRWLVAIGDWSYSIYLLHLPIAFAAGRMLTDAGMPLALGDLSASIIALITVVITLPLSAAVYHWAELPGIAIGTRIVRRFTK